MKLSLISATSIFALLAIGSVRAAPLTARPDQTNIYDLVHDGMTSMDGGDRTVSKQDPLVTALLALSMATNSWQSASFTGLRDPVTAPNAALSRVPLGAAAGSTRNDDFATSAPDAWRWTGTQRQQARGADRIAPLIGSVATTASAKPGSTVFVAAGSQTGFIDRHSGGGRRLSGSPGTSPAPFSASSSSTAAITVAGVGSFRPRAEPEFAAAASDHGASDDGTSPSSETTLLLPADSRQSTLGYTYAPPPSPASTVNAVEASFPATPVIGNRSSLAVAPPAASLAAGSSSVASTEEKGAQGRIPANARDTGAGGAKVRTSDRRRAESKELASIGRGGNVQAGVAAPGTGASVESGAAGSASMADSHLFALYRGLIEATSNAGQNGGSVSAMVSANPLSLARRTVVRALEPATALAAAASVEAFQIGTTAASPDNEGPTPSVSTPLLTNIIAGSGALDNSLLLP